MPRRVVTLSVFVDVKAFKAFDLRSLWVTPRSGVCRASARGFVASRAVCLYTRMGWAGVMRLFAFGGESVDCAASARCMWGVGGWRLSSRRDGGGDEELG